MKKRITKLVAGLLVTGMMVIPAYADTMIARIQTCPLCSVGGLVKQASEYSPWKTVGSTDCEHGDPFAKDKIQERTVTTDYVCDNCGYVETRERVETRQVHP